MKAFIRPLAGLSILLLSSLSHAADGQAIYQSGGASPSALACITCHGPDAMGMAEAGFPRLAGLPAAYIGKQVHDFRDEKRSHPIMYPIAQALTDEEISAVAAYLTALPAPAAPVITRAAAVKSEGETLALRGAWSRNIPECVTCHGPGGSGVGTAFPPLYGQSALYLSTQLNAWRQGSRKNDPDDLMGHIARALTEQEIESVSAYFATLGQQEGHQ